MFSSGKVQVYNHNKRLKNVKIRNIISASSLSLFPFLFSASICYHITCPLLPFSSLFCKVKIYLCFQVKSRALISALSHYKAMKFSINLNFKNFIVSTQKKNCFKLVPCFSSNLSNYVYFKKLNLFF